MPDRRRHRGPHPEDALAFAAEAAPALAAATSELSWLYTHGYAKASSVKIVGDRYSLTERQRIAVMRSACSDQDRSSRLRRQVAITALRGETVRIDGYNLLTTVEAALAGGVLILGRDGCHRDMASMAGRFHWVEETSGALLLIGEALVAMAPIAVQWLLDRPVSNSGKLAGCIRELAAANGWPWEVDVVDSPDAALISGGSVVATADGPVLNRCGRWVNLARHIVERYVPGAHVVLLGCDRIDRRDADWDNDRMAREYHHVGIPTKERHPNEIYLESVKIWITDATRQEHGIEWLRFEPDSPMHPLVKTVPHVGFKVDDLSAAIKGRKVIVPPFQPMAGLTVAFIEDDGAPVEFLEFRK